MTSKLSPSIMCVDFFDLENSVKEFEQNDIEYIHVDIMDGKFVGNYTLGTDFIKSLKAKCSIPLDIHLMIENPENKLDWFAFGENDYVAVHAEATCHLQRCWQVFARAAQSRWLRSIRGHRSVCLKVCWMTWIACW